MLPKKCFISSVPEVYCQPESRSLPEKLQFIVSAFEQQVERSPDSIAIVMGEQSLSYADLNRRANQLAYYLRALGVGCETLVGICAERSIVMLVGLLGILKAGGTYLPLDPTYPKDFLRFMLNDSGLKILLTQETFTHIAWDRTIQEVCLDRDWGRISVYSAHNPVPATTANNLAYVIYTSGSTGKPKGVMVCHRGFDNYLRWCIQQYGAARGQGSPVHSSISFDLTVTSLFAPLLVGKTVFLLPDDIEALSSALCNPETDFSLVKITPTHLRLLEQSFIGKEVLGKVRTVVVGGEVLTNRDVASWQQKAPYSRLVNEYGPTETVVGCTAYEVPGEGGASLTVPIGRPIANTCIYVLDENLLPVPAEIAGTLYAGGDGVARGYLNRPDLTAQCFVPDPFGNEGARLYCTGDRARFRPDGVIEFLGRTDGQVKIRGYRIELDELEVALRDFPGVHQAGVAIKGKDGTTELVGCVAGIAGVRLDFSDIRRYLQEKLPEYMLPSRLVQIAGLPVTVNGKLDRERLAMEVPEECLASVEKGPLQPEDHEKPETVAHCIARFMAEVLGRPKVGVDDSISDLGMNSLLIARFLARIRVDLGAVLTFRHVLEMQTPARLAEFVSQAPPANVPRLRPRPDVSRIPLTSFQFPYWVGYQMDPDNRLTENRLFIQCSGPLDQAALQRALDQVFWRHDILRTTFPEDQSGPHQVRARRGQGKFPLSVVDLRGAAQASHADIFTAITRAASLPLDLLAGPVIRATLLRLSELDHLLLIIAHPIVADGLSLEVMFRDLAASYRSSAAGEPPSLPVLPVQYSDFALWEAERLTPDKRRQQESFWKRQLASPLPALLFPATNKRPAVAVWKSHARLTLAQCTLLKNFAAQEQCSTVMVLLAGVKLLLAQKSEQTDVLVGVVTGHRSDPLLHDLMGPFADVLPVRTSLDGTTSFRSILSRARQSLLNAFDHSDLRLNELLRLVGSRPRSGPTQLCEVLLNVLEAIPDQRIGDLWMRAKTSLHECGIAEPDGREQARKMEAPSGAGVNSGSSESQPAPFALYFTGTLDGSGLALELQGNARLFAESMVSDLLQRFVQILMTGLMRPDEAEQG